MEIVILNLVFWGLITCLCWFSANMTAAYAIYKAKDGDHMIRIMLNDTYAMTAAGVLLWIWLPDVQLLLWLLTLRAFVLSMTRWHVIHERFNEIKFQMDRNS